MIFENSDYKKREITKRFIKNNHKNTITNEQYAIVILGVRSNQKTKSICLFIKKVNQFFIMIICNHYYFTKKQSNID